MKKTHTLNRQQRQSAFDRTMDQVYTYTNPVHRQASRYFHLHINERAFDILGSTLARPLPLIIGSITAITVVTALYIPAKQLGYSLAGSEPLFAFGLGWLAGMIVDYMRLLIRGKRTYR